MENLRCAPLCLFDAPADRISEEEVAGADFKPALLLPLGFL
jgi:hypothetical protein